MNLIEKIKNMDSGTLGAWMMGLPVVLGLVFVSLASPILGIIILAVLSFFVGLFMFLGA